MMTRHALLVLLALSIPADATAVPLSEAAKARICLRVKALVARLGAEGAIQWARRRGYSEEQISAAHSCF